MAVIGLTGGIATGKSTVCNMLCDMGARIFDADREAHLLLAEGGKAADEIKTKFSGELGLDILAEDGNIDRKKLGAIVFSNKELLHYLESVMHHHIEKGLHEFVSEEKKKNAMLIVLDIPLLLEKDWQDKSDEVWLVYVPKKVQLERLKARDGITNDEAEKRLAAQMPIDDKKDLADVIIDNVGSLDLTREQVQQAVKRILK